MTIRLDYGLILAVYLGLILFGVGYNALVSWLDREGYVEGYLAFIVAIGVAVSLAGVALLSWQAALLALGAFTASGIPMIIGSVSRYVKRRRAAQQTLSREALRE